MRYSHTICQSGDLIGAPDAAILVMVRCRQAADPAAGVRQDPETAGIAPNGYGESTRRPDSIKRATPLPGCPTVPQWSSCPSPVRGSGAPRHQVTRTARNHAHTTLVRSSSSTQGPLRMSATMTEPGQTSTGTSTTLVPVPTTTAVGCVTPSTGVESAIAWVRGTGFTAATTMVGTALGVAAAATGTRVTEGGAAAAMPFFPTASARGIYS
jgi:hypothetical protein